MCWEPCGPVLDQHRDTYPMGLHEARPIEIVFNSAMTGVPQVRAEYCWGYAACTVLSLS